MRRRWSTVSAALACVGLVACAARDRVRPGLANAPALGGDTAVVAHDAVTNGQDSCPRRRIEGKDPLAHRVPPCPTTVEARPSPAPAPPAPPPAVGVPWNVHLDGLPPCDVQRAAWASARESQACRR